MNNNPYHSELDLEAYVRYCGMGIRVLALRDSLKKDRDLYLSYAFVNITSLYFEDHNTRLLASIDGEFKTLIMHGEDNARLTGFLRRNAAFLKGKAKLCIKTRIWPEDAANLLNAGFDDVFDLKMSRDEVIARFLAIHRRRSDRIDRETLGYSGLSQEDIKVYIQKAISIREAHVLAKLVSKRGGVVSCADLARPSQRLEVPLGKKSLVVFLSKLRRKLKDGFYIISSSGEGYAFKEKRSS